MLQVPKSAAPFSNMGQPTDPTRSSQSLKRKFNSSPYEILTQNAHMMKLRLTLNPHFYSTTKLNLHINYQSTNQECWSSVSSKAGVVRPGSTANEVSLAGDGCQNYLVVLTFSKQIHNYGNQTQLISFVVVDPYVRPDMTISNLIQLPLVAHPTCRLVCLLLALPSRPKYQVVHPQLQAGLHSITGSNVTIINQILQCCITRDSRAQPRGAGSKKDLLNYGVIKTGGYPIPFKMKCSYWNGQNRSLKDIFNHR